MSKKKASEAQFKALSKTQKTQKRNIYYRAWWLSCGKHIKAGNSAIEWAKKVLAQKDNWVILDMETTGLYDAEIIQIGICNLDGEIILDSLIRPIIAIPFESTSIHGITDELVKLAPAFPELYPQIIESLKNKQVLIYNVDFDIGIIDYCCKLHKLKLLDLRKKSDCLMRYYAQFCGDWNDYYQSYRWQPLHGDHSAIGDCLAALLLLKKMSESKIIDADEAFEKFWLRRNNR